MRLKSLKTMNELGDTIIEVMIVLSILGLALSISYATANRSLLNTRQAQENSTATELAQSEIESLIPLAGKPSTDPNYIYGPPTTFCIVSGSVSTSAAACSNIDIYYNIAITRTDMVNDTFKVVITWNDVTGQGTDGVTLEYRLYPPS